MKQFIQSADNELNGDIFQELMTLSEKYYLTSCPSMGDQIKKLADGKSEIYGYISRIYNSKTGNVYSEVFSREYRICGNFDFDTENDLKLHNFPVFT